MERINELTSTGQGLSSPGSGPFLRNDPSEVRPYGPERQGVSLADAIAATDALLDGAAPDATSPRTGLEAGAPPAAAVRSAAAERLVLFSIAAADYAVSETFVTELERIPQITPVPRVPAWVRGVTNLRGDILSVIDMRAFLRLDGPAPPSARLLVVRVPDEDFATGLLIDAVHRIVAVPSDAIAPPATPLDGPLAAYLRGVCQVNERLVAVLDLDRLLRSADVRQFDDPQDVVTDED